MKTSARRSIAIVALVAVGAGLIALNTVLAFTLRSARIDLTEQRLYSVSPGVKDLVRGLDEKVRANLYWSESVGADLPQYRMLAQRVYEFLDELSRASGGKLEVRRIDPKPFSEDEDTARAAGLTVRPVDGTGRTLTLGLIIEGPTDKVETMPSINPEDEPFLEYEIARRIVSVERAKKPVVAVLSTIPESGPFDPRNPSARGQSSVLIQQLRALFDVRFIEVPQEGAPVLPPEAEALMLIQPRDWSEATLRVIDAWTVAGKPLLAFVDPWCETDPAARAAAASMGGGGNQGTTFDLGPLLASWGIELARDGQATDSIAVVADMKYATRVQSRTAGGQIMELAYVPWLSLTRDALVQHDPITGTLTAINMMTAGSIRKAEGGTTKVEPMVMSSPESQLVQTMKLGFFGQPDRLIKDFQAIGEPQWLAVRITGPIKSAFPPAEGAAASEGTANIVVVADADLLQNDTWVQEQRFGGQSLGYTAFADNAGLALNALETLTGKRALSELRGRGQYRRPFEKVEELRRAAEVNYLAEEERLQQEIRESEQRINQLQREKAGAGANTLVLSPEQQAELKKLETAVADARKKLRGVQRNLREDVDRLGRNLMILNIVLWPIFVALLALLWLVGRHRRQRQPVVAGGAA